MKKSDVADILSAVFVLAIISLLVRPSSVGPDLVKYTGTALEAVVEFAVSS
jgi:hypothetical protein